MQAIQRTLQSKNSSPRKQTAYGILAQATDIFATSASAFYATYSNNRATINGASLPSQFEST